MAKRNEEAPEETPLEVPKVSQLPDLKTPSQHAASLGLIRQVREDLGDSPYSPDHLGADVLNGWSRLQSYTGEQPKIYQADYKAALEAAKGGKDHAPANFRSQLPAPAPIPSGEKKWKTSSHTVARHMAKRAGR